MKILGTTVAAALLLLALTAVAGVGSPEPARSAAEDRRGITVTGTGRVDAAPDQAEVSLGVTTQGATARDALAENSAQMRRLIAALKAAGVDERDTRTTEVSVWPTGERAGGYMATNSVLVRIREIDRAGAVLDAASNAGANQIYGPSLTRQEREALEAKALALAVDDARKRAKALARAAGVEVGRVTSIVEQPDVGYESGSRLALSASTGDVPVEKGTQEIAATVTVTFAIE
jgi:uncharacterized protein YggE